MVEQVITPINPLGKIKVRAANEPLKLILFFVPYSTEVFLLVNSVRMCVCMQTCAGTRGQVVDDQYEHCEIHGKSYSILLCHHLSDDVLQQMCKRDLLPPEKALFSFQRRDPILSFGPIFRKHHRANGVKRRVINSSSGMCNSTFHLVDCHGFIAHAGSCAQRTRGGGN